MNEAHLNILSSPDWANTLREELLPWVVQAGDLGDELLQLGPGPGLSTELLMPLARSLTAVELDPGLAAAGFSEVSVSTTERRVRFIASKL